MEAKDLFTMASTIIALLVFDRPPVQEVLPSDRVAEYLQMPKLVVMPDRC